MGCKIKIDFLFAALLAFVAVTDKTMFAVCGLVLIAAHELGHIFAAIALKMQIREINFGVANIDISKPQDYEARKLSEKAVLILGGCIFNFLIFLVLWLIYLRTGKSEVLYIAMQSFAIAVLSIFPVESLDGGELLDLFTEKFCKDFRRAKKICSFVSWIFLFLLTALGILIIVECRCGFSVILLILYLVYQKYT